MEIWKDIEGYEGLYQVSNFGRIRSLGNGIRNSKLMILKPRVNRKGYLQVGLSKNGKHKTFTVHKLVASAFIQNLFDEREVNHIDEDKTNNNVENLEWCDHKYNCNYGTCIKRRNEKNTNGKRSKTVLQFTKTGEFVREWASASETARNGFHQGAVCSCCRGEAKSHKGFIWRYKESA